MAVIKYESSFSDNYLLRISDESESFEMQRIIEKFRHLARLKNIAHIDPVAAAFGANATVNVFINPEVDTSQPTFNEQRLSGMRQSISFCICGYKHL